MYEFCNTCGDAMTPAEGGECTRCSSIKEKYPDLWRYILDVAETIAERKIDQHRYSFLHEN